MSVSVLLSVFPPLSISHQSMPSPSPNDPAREPLLPPPATSPTSSSSAPSSSPRRTSLLGARRVPSTPERRLSSKAKGKQRAAPLSTTETHGANIDIDLEKGVGLGLRPPAEIASSSIAPSRPPPVEERGRCVSVIFSGGAGEGEGNLEVWVEPGESVGSVKEQVSTTDSDPHWRRSLEVQSSR